MEGLLESLSALSTVVITAACGVHFFVFFILWNWASRSWQRIISLLDDFTRSLANRSVLDYTAHKSDQIEAFLADVSDVLEDPTRADDRRALLERVNILDSKRRYLNSLSFETFYNMTRTMIEAYPLAGVLGTVLAIGAALAGDPSVNAIVARFGDAIWSTCAGLAAFMILLFFNSMLEPGFQRLSENRKQVREMIARVKRELSLRVTTANCSDASTSHGVTV